MSKLHERFPHTDPSAPALAIAPKNAHFLPFYWLFRAFMLYYEQIKNCAQAFDPSLAAAADLPDERQGIVTGPLVRWSHTAQILQ